MTRELCCRRFLGKRRPIRITFGALALLAAALAAGPSFCVEAGPPEPVRPGPSRASRPRADRPRKHDLSPPLRNIPPVIRPTEEIEPSPNPGLPGRGAHAGAPALRADPRYEAATSTAAGPMPPAGLNFPGLGNVNGVVPPDTNGAVGPHHFMQWVNASVAIWDKAGNLVYGPVSAPTLWSGFGGICEQKTGGDGIILYDHLADRWFVSQLSFEWPHNFHQCIAVSQTPDPTGAWYRYDYLWDNDVLNDYPKFAVWPDGYYMAVNQYLASTQEYRGQAVAVFEREKMLHGEDAQMIRFDLYAVNPLFGGQLPADLDGPIPPPQGAPAYFLEVDDDAWGWPSDRIQLWKFHADWTNPSLSTYGAGGNPNAVIDLGALGYSFDSDLCGYSNCCLLEPAGNRLSALSDRPMWRLAYRNFGTRESLTVNHTVDVDGSDHAGIRWYEVRNPASTPVLFQGGTYAPDANHRWMGSMAMDGQGNIAVGYSVSGAAIYPSIRYAGRLASDPPGALPRIEATLVAGVGTQNSACRWGDYSAMTLDPTDDCTFWYTQEYYATSGPFPWSTRIGAFRFDSCRSCPLVGTPDLSVVKISGGTRLGWTAPANASAFGVVEGSLSVLRSTHGDFAQATSRCLADESPDSSLLLADPVPAAGDGVFYLVDGKMNGCLGTFDETGSGQVGSRDAEIKGAALACPVSTAQSPGELGAFAFRSGPHRLR